MKIQSGVTVKQTQAFKRIGHGVRVDKVHDNPDAHIMGSIYELLKLIRGAEARRRGEEA